MTITSEIKPCSYNSFPDDSKVNTAVCFPRFGRIHSSKMYAVNCPDLDHKSGLYEFIYSMDNEEMVRVEKDHKLVEKMNEVSSNNLKMGVIVGGAVGIGVSMPFLLASSAVLIASTFVLNTTFGISSGVLTAYSKTQEVTQSIELDRMRRLANKVSLIAIQYGLCEKENDIRGMRNLKILQNYFEATLNQHKDITFFS